MLNQIRMGLRVPPEERCEKPQELIRFEMMQETGLPLWEGGLQDQPHLWLKEMGVVRKIVRLFEAMQKGNEHGSSNPKNG